MRLITICCILLIHFGLYSQDTKRKLYKEKNSKGIVEEVAFDKMISRYITYAITGEQNPTAGIKVDLAKATGTLTGYIINEKGFDVLIDVGLGVTEGSAAIFDSYKNLHSDFNATVNFVWTPRWSSALMYPKIADVVRTSRQIFKTNLYTNKTDSLLTVLLIIKANKLKVEDSNGNLYPFSATDYLNEQLLDSKLVGDEEYDDAIKYIKSIIANEDQITSDGFKDEDTVKLSSTQQQLLRDLAKRYVPEIKTNKLVFMYKTLSLTKARSDLMLADLIRAMGKIISGRDENVNYQLALAEKYWTVKNLKWVTFTPFVRRQGFSLFDQSALNRTDTSSVTFGLGIRFNQLVDWRTGLFHWKAGLDFFRANNLTDFTKVEYVQRDSLTSDKGKYLYSEKKGVSYTGMTLDRDFGIAFSIEAYLFLSKRNFFPGVYVKYDITQSKVLKNDNVSVIEFGFPFNINSPDKSKSALSVAPYMRFANLNAVDNPEIANEIERDDFQIGLRIGLPINIASNGMK
ncbi:hypothetical protein KK083_07480 [Fulvivirgaceae bacterium PWU4]|uniref:Uncharacterized protein n=1 Tax=Chryseosolibacter histidini TaxID=2782349 RepID=A0AAP2DJL3_9BACT|nr:hypothetical protein [Chryseosolibacter histidini]MBT1696709.1 hypothetical protein [Chryseosolibacter histidini]